MYQFFDWLAFRSSLTAMGAASLVSLVVLSGCAETEDDADLSDAGSFVTGQADAYVPPPYVGGPTTGNPAFPDLTPTYADASVYGDASTSYPDSAATSPDASGGFNLDDILGGGGTPEAGVGGGGNTGNPGKGELDPNGAINPKLPPKSDNPKECPSLAPPNPVGNCLGLPIYLLCGYGAPGGPQYSCTCDWYHWLCV